MHRKSYSSSVLDHSIDSLLSIYSISHVLAVTTLSFCPKKELPQGVVARLASGSEDRSVRIFDIRL